MTEGSLQTEVRVDEEAQGAYCEHWSGAFTSDLRGAINSLCADLTRASTADFAAKATAWFEDAWSRAGSDQRRFQITTFRFRIFDEPGQCGEVLAEIDVLTGNWRIA